jgi:Flagellar assembly protein FliH
VQQRTDFVPLAAFLRPPSVAPAQPEPPPAPSSAPVPVEYVEALGAARRFHAGLRDALDVAVGQCLQRIARDVLARELQLAPPEVASIVRAALGAYAAEKVLTIRANPRDLQALRAFGLELIGSEALRAGDIELVLRSGTIDLTLMARLDNALALWNA